ncbi:NUDIX domain-containing protein [Paenibacillus gansuensis]|uniref:NUDIX domain-containing protein n=1 Tax=Paenibacillus gansuensis TaxID=306542 RepID=A0ABW5PE26_9BACL
MQTPNQKYHVLARGVILSGEYILVAHCIGMDNTFLPGGHVEFREGMKETLAREIAEEFGEECEVGTYLGAVEADFEQEDSYHQEINHVFQVTLPNLPHRVNPRSLEAHLEFYWIHLEEMIEHNLQPEPVRDIVKGYYRRDPGPFWGSTFDGKTD